MLIGIAVSLTAGCNQLLARVSIAAPFFLAGMLIAAARLVEIDLKKVPA